MLSKLVSNLFLAIIPLTLLAGSGCSQATKAQAPVRVLMVAGTDGYPFAAQAKQFARRLTERGRLSIDLPNEPKLDPQKISQYDVLFFNPRPGEKIAPQDQQAILQHLKAGKGLVAMEAALFSYADWSDWADLLGGSAVQRHKPDSYKLTVLDTDNTITLGLGRELDLFEEPPLIEKFDNQANLLVRTTQTLTGPSGQERPRPSPEPLVWTKEHDGGRIFVAALGHNQKTLTDERFISIIHNGILWAAQRLPQTPHNTLTKAEKQEGYQLLFNSKDLTGWSGDPRFWSVRDGCIVGSSAKTKLEHNTFLIHDKPYSDFILKCSVKLTNHNSGVQIRSLAYPDYVVKGYQADIADQWWGSLYDENTGRDMLAQGFKDKAEHVVINGGWNQITIKALGPKIAISLNGLKTIEYTEKDMNMPTSGVIALQLHQGPPMEVRFRDLKILPLEKKP